MKINNKIINCHCYTICLLLAFTGLIVTQPASGNGFLAFNTISNRYDGIPVKNIPADTTLIKRTGNFTYVSSPRLRRPATLRSKKNFKKFSIKRSRKVHSFRKKRFVSTRYHNHRKQLYALLGNAVQMEELHFRLNALAPEAPDWKAALDSVLQPYLNGTEAYDSILVVGYTDNTGSKKTNLSLSAKRAARVMTWLVQQGIPENRIHTVAMGEEAPVSSNSSIEGRRLNRRVEINFLRSS